MFHFIDGFKEGIVLFAAATALSILVHPAFFLIYIGYLSYLTGKVVIGK